jgi:hypothetical protein
MSTCILDRCFQPCNGLLELDEVNECMNECEHFQYGLRYLDSGVYIAVKIRWYM